MKRTDLTAMEHLAAEQKKQRPNGIKIILSWVVLVWTVCSLPRALQNLFTMDFESSFFTLIYIGLIIGLMIDDILRG